MEGSNHHQELSKRNNRACSLVEDGQFDQAIIEFTGLLSCSKRIMDNFAASKSDSSCCELSPPTTSLDACMMPSSLPVSMTKDGSQFSSSSSPDNAYIYRHPIRLPRGLRITYGNGVLVSTVVMFNLALCHHLRAYSLCKPTGNLCNHSRGDDHHSRMLVSMASLEKAVRLYELSYCLQLEENLNDGNNVYFTMTTINNLGMIHSALGRHTTAKRCFQHLLSTMVFLIDQKEVAPMDGFIQNTSFLVIRENTAAAA